MKHPRSSGGFSLVELMVVVAVILIISAVAVPSLMNTINNLRLRSMVTTVSGVIQNGRMVSIKYNRQYKVRYAQVGSSSVVFIDRNDDGTPDASEPQAQLGGTIIELAAPVGVAPMDSVLGYPLGTGNLSFNPRGLPCTTTSNCGQVGFVMYFTDQRKVGGTGYAAVSVTPAGRVKAWMWSGSGWSD